MFLEFCQFAGGISVLVFGAWLLIGGGTRIAAVLGVPPIVVGLTIVAFGTSAPELFVSLVGALKGSTGLVLGNVIGSNVANLGLILGAAAVLRPVIVEKKLVKREVPLLLIASLLFAGLAADGEVSRIDASVLVVGFGIFMWLTLRDRSRGAVIIKQSVDLSCPSAEHRLRSVLIGSVMVLVGIVGLAAGGSLIIKAALVLAQKMGISETVIGLTLVAVGTSLPELATTIVAAWRDQDDLALGNVVGSNLFNLLAVAGPVGMIKPLVSEGPGLFTQLGCMLLLTLLVFVMIVHRGGAIRRMRGLALLLVYVATTAVWIII